MGYRKNKSIKESNWILNMTLRINLRGFAGIQNYSKNLDCIVTHNTQNLSFYIVVQHNMVQVLEKN